VGKTVVKKKIPIEVTSWLPRPASDYPGCYPLGFEKYLKDWLQTENYVHFFGGKAKTGYRIDIVETLSPNLCANVETLPMIVNEQFEGGMADPPYDERFAKEKYNCKYPKWGKWTAELVRVVKVGGLIAIMQNYIVPKLTKCAYEKIYIIPLRIKQFPKVVTIQRRID
jgi:hypothetical protein